jgi:hypothetical protein
MRNRQVENGGNFVEPPGRDAVRALLVFLDLLEGDAQLARHVFLGDTRG